MARKIKAAISDLLRVTIRESGIPLLVLERDTGVKRQSIMRFLRGERSLHLDNADSLATFFGLELTQTRGKEMAKLADTQDARVARVKEYLRARPGVPSNFLEIGRATGVPRSRIDYERTLSSDPEIERTEATRKRGVRWTYIGST